MKLEQKENKSFPRPKERTLRKTITYEVTEKPVSFTTERKHKHKSTINISRKGSIVKERCRQLTEVALDLCPNRRISHRDLTFLVKEYIGADRNTVRAYLGYKNRVSHSKKPGQLSKIIGHTREGYLVTFGFMHPIAGKFWLIHAQSQLSPLSPSPPLRNNESIDRKIIKENISLSQDREKHTVNVSYTNRINNNNTVRERNFTPKISPKINTSKKKTWIDNEYEVFKETEEVVT